MSKRSLCATLVSLLTLGLVACGGGVQEVRFGAVISLTGPGTEAGPSVRNGIELAVEQVNEAGGVLVHETGNRIPLVIEFRDAANQPQSGAAAARELIETGVPAIIGAVNSDITLAVAPICQQAGVILLSPGSSSPKLSEAGDFIYRNYPSDELEAVNLADHVYNRMSLREIAIVASQSEFGMGIRNAFIQRFRALGGRVASQATFEPGTTGGAEFTAAAEAAVASEAGGIYIAGYSAETAAVARAIRELDQDVQLFATGAILPSVLIEDGGDAVEGLVFPSTLFDPDSDAPPVREFVSAYRAEYGGVPDTFAAHGYDAVNILVQAVEQAGLRPDEMSFYMNTMNPFPGAAGETKFDDSGNVRKFHRMFVIRDGAAVPLGTASTQEPGT